jgi:hypothetical protein
MIGFTNILHIYNTLKNKINNGNILVHGATPRRKDDIGKTFKDRLDDKKQS